MKTIQLSLVVISILFIYACSESESPPEEPTEKILELTYPLVGDDVHYCCFSFEWDDDSDEKEYRLEIAKYTSFNDLLLDTIIKGTSLEFPSFLSPRGTYVWRVTDLESEESQKSEFKIIDYADFLSGSYDATIKKYAWNGLEGTTTDTTFETTLSIWKGDDHSISYKSSDSNGEKNIPFSELYTEGHVLYRIDHSYPRDIDYVRYFFEDGSIVTYRESGGNGGGGYTKITAVKK